MLVIGDSGTGKTSLIHRYVLNKFRSEDKTTIGIDFAIKILNWDANTDVKLEIWDIAGKTFNITKIQLFSSR